MISGKVEGEDKARQALAKVPVKIVSAARKILSAESVLMASMVKSQYLTGGTTDDRLAVRTGDLRASTRAEAISQEGGTVKAGISFGTIYARVHIGPEGQETIIKPKNKKYLTIPLDAAKTRAGVIKGAAQSGRYGDTFFAKSKKGNLILFGKNIATRGKRAGKTVGDIVPLFLLVKEVRVKSRVHPEDIIEWEKPRMIEAFKDIGIELRNI